MFLDSGLADFLIPEQPIYVPPPSGNIIRQKNYTADGEKAYNFIRFAESKIGIIPTKRRHTYNTLIELMTNTRHHADPSKNKPWWLSVYHHEKAECVSFTFVDTGVGIFESVGPTMEFYKKALSALGSYNNISFMKQLLEGNLRSSTKQPHRGKGIPSINQYAAEGVMQNLTIITNDVYAAVSRQDYHHLDEKFPGTLWYWELTPQRSMR